LKLSWGTADSVTIQDYYVASHGTAFQIELIEFANGTRWLAQDIADRLTYNGTDADDVMFGTYNYANRINGDSGNDFIHGGDLADALRGEAGNDTLSGSNGNDTLIGGTGNDFLDGEYGSDTYIFNKGDGHDTISDMDWERYYGRIGDTDILKLGAGLAVADTVISRVGNDLKLSWGTADSVTIQDYYVASHGTAFQIELIEFANGTRWLAQDIADRLTYNGTDADDVMFGTYNYANRINGDSGNDFIHGGDLADALRGEAGNDTLSGSNGNDTLIGGTGNDFLDGEYGSDTYIFNKGDGHDTISDMDWERYYGRIGDTDILKLGAGLAVADTVISRVGNDLKLSWGTADSVTIQDYYLASHGTAFQIEQIEFADGTRWLAQDIADKLTYNGTDADDYLYGSYNYANRINGGDGNDFISGGSLDDVLKGDAGNDTLMGGSGNDTYLFGRGSGADVISDYDSTSDNADKVSISAGVSKEQLWFRQVGNDLEMSIIGTQDKTTISDWYSGSSYRVESFNTSSGSALLENQVDALVSAMAAFAPPAPGQTSLPANYQATLNSVIAASWQ
ncbi:MAG: hypothetical protein JNJ51_06470, partial [Methylobacillus glycogenes]|nr:hypothetical protein [Methylobacillus glycogenes]